jgi:hypothetical protein
MAWPLILKSSARHSVCFRRRCIDLFPDQVESCDHFGNRVLHLDPGVHLDEIEILMFIDQELNGAGIGIVDAACQAEGGGSDPFPVFPVRWKGQGASSMIFWYRRCRVHSLSKR